MSTLLKIPDVCERLQISREMLYRLWQRGKGPKRLMIGRSVRVDERDLNDWLEAGKEERGKSE